MLTHSKNSLYIDDLNSYSAFAPLAVSFSLSKILIVWPTSSGLLVRMTLNDSFTHFLILAAPLPVEGARVSICLGWRMVKDRCSIWGVGVELWRGGEGGRLYVQRKPVRPTQASKRSKEKETERLFLSFN